MRRRRVMVALGVLCFAVVTALVAVQTSFRPQDRPGLRLEGFRAITLTRQQNDRLIGRLEEQIRRHGETPQRLRMLAQAYLQQVRETGDFAYYRKAERVFRRILENPEAAHAEAMEGMAEIALGRHHFLEAEKWARQAVQRMPHRARPYGLLADAQIELGRYEQAKQSLDRMMAIRPDLSAYSRVSYFRELHGDVEGAISAMTLALKAGVPGEAATEWCRVQLGMLQFNRGALAQAEALFLQTLELVPGYPYAHAGLGKVRLAQGRYQEAVEHFKTAFAAARLADFCLDLAEAYRNLGLAAQPVEQEMLAWQLLESEATMGIDTALEMAMAGLRTGREPGEMLALANQAYARRPTVLAAEVLAWAQYRAGALDAAQTTLQEAMRLGTQSARLFYRAGIIAYAAGDLPAAAGHLRRALQINPYFSTTLASSARVLLDSLTASLQTTATAQ